MKGLTNLLFAAALLGAGYWLWTHGRAGSAFDPSKDAKAELREALAAARRGNKRVLLEVGSDACLWCKRLDRFMEADPAIRELAQKSFITVRLDYQAGRDLLAAYPPITGTPYFYVLDKDGALLSPQDTDSFESGDSYDRGKLLAFFQAWAPPS
ncbi:MAG: thioredoxin family protein [Elusimicrobia bacterium]|nr:thioredoxin family protein [Elusimicrobiota bacterium]